MVKGPIPDPDANERRILETRFESLVALNPGKPMQPAAPTFLRESDKRKKLASYWFKSNRRSRRTCNIIPSMTGDYSTGPPID